MAAGGLPGISWSLENDQLHIRNYADVTYLDPALSVSGAEGLIGNAIFQNLLQFKTDGSWDWELSAAAYFEQVDDTHYAFRLRPGQMFNNDFGEMTADDVKFSLERIIDPALLSPNAGDMGTLSHVELHDRYAGTIVLHSPFAALVSIALTSGTGAILSRKAVESIGGKFTIEPPCGSGPYQFRAWRSKRKTILERNPAWTGPVPEFSEIHIYAMNDDKAAELAYEAGELDCAQISVESIDVFRKNMPPRSSIEVFQSLRYYWLGMNMENPSLRDIRVRRAIQYAIDVEAVIEAAWFGLAEPATGIIAPGLIGHREQADIPPAGDPDKARQLLTQAGVELPLRLRLDLNSDSLEMTAAQVMQWSLRKVGIEVGIFGQDNGSFLTIGKEEFGEQWKDVQLFIQSFYMLGDPYYATEWFISKQVGVWNWERFQNEEFDRLHELALATTAAAERDRMYQRMQHLMEASGAYRFISHGVQASLYRNWLEPAFRADGYPVYRKFSRNRSA